MARVCPKRERLPSCLLIENAPPSSRLRTLALAGAFPIKPSDHPGVGQFTDSIACACCEVYGTISDRLEPLNVLRQYERGVFLWSLIPKRRFCESETKSQAHFTVLGSATRGSATRTGR